MAAHGQVDEYAAKPNADRKELLSMCKFYNGKEITADNLKAEILDYTNNSNNPQDDLSEETRKIFEKMVAGYPGVDDDIEFIVDKLREDSLTQANLQDVEDVLKLGGFDFEKQAE